MRWKQTLHQLANSLLELRYCDKNQYTIGSGVLKWSYKIFRCLFIFSFSCYQFEFTFSDMNICVDFKTILYKLLHKYD